MSPNDERYQVAGRKACFSKFTRDKAQNGLLCMLCKFLANQATKIIGKGAAFLERNLDQACG